MLTACAASAIPCSPPAPHSLLRPFAATPPPPCLSDRPPLPFETVLTRATFGLCKPVRYSGPAFQPINDFLRQISRLQGVYRTQLARTAKLSFAATVGHICRAIRKLAAVETDEEVRPSADGS